MVIDLREHFETLRAVRRETMGWASGSQLAEHVWNLVREHLKPEMRSTLAEALISAFEDEDADDWDVEHPIWKDAGRPGAEE